MNFFLIIFDINILFIDFYCWFILFVFFLINIMVEGILLFELYFELVLVVLLVDNV